MSTRLGLLAAAATLAVAGCASPTADGMGVRPDFAVPSQLRSVTLCVSNPNPDALVLSRITVTIDRDGAPLEPSASGAAVVVPALSSTRLPLTVLAIGRDQATQLGRPFRMSDIDYRVDGSVALDRAFGLNIPYRHAGHLKIVSPSADGAPSPCTGSDVAVPL